MPPRPGPHPEPPADLASRQLPLLKTARAWFRLHSGRHPPLYFGTGGDNRFDTSHAGFGVLYAGSDPHGAFIETFGHATVIKSVTTRGLQERLLCRVEVNRELLLVDLSGPGLSRVRADERLCSGDIPVAQRWALALWAHPQAPDGLYYRARHDPSRFSAAIFDRAQDAVRAVPMGTLMDYHNQALLADILDCYDFDLRSPTNP